MMRRPYFEEGRRYSSFWPLAMLACAIAANLTLRLYDAVQQRRQTRLILESRTEPLARAREASAEVERLARDLVRLAQQDPEAKAIVDKFGISVEPTR